MIVSCKQYKNNHSSFVYGKMKTYGTLLYPVTWEDYFITFIGEVCLVFPTKSVVKKALKGSSSSQIVLKTIQRE